MIPHLYNGRNKTFIFGNFSEFIQHNGSSGVVLTFRQKPFAKGIFRPCSDLCGTDRTGNQVFSGTIYDPYSTRPNGQSGFIRSPYQGNIIPASQLSACLRPGNLDCRYPSFPASAITS